MDVAKVSIFRAIWMISSLSMPIQGRKTGIDTTALVTFSASIVWEATLAHAFAGDECVAGKFLCRLLGQPHHAAAQQKREIVLGADRFNSS